MLFIRSASLMPGKMGPGLGWAAKVAALASEVTGNKVEVHTRVGGNYSEITWVAQFKSLSDYDGSMTKLFADQRYLAAVGEAGSFIVPNTTHDSILRPLAG